MANANILLNKCPLDTGARSVLFSQIFGSRPCSPQMTGLYIYINKKIRVGQTSTLTDLSWSNLLLPPPPPPPITYPWSHPWGLISSLFNYVKFKILSLS